MFMKVKYILEEIKQLADNLTSSHSRFKKISLTRFFRPPFIFSVLLLDMDGMWLAILDVDAPLNKF